MKITDFSPFNRTVTSILALFLVSTGCEFVPSAKAATHVAGSNKKDSSKTTENSVVALKEPASAAAIMGRRQIPILCYHQIRNWRPADSKQAKDYIVPEAVFSEQIKMLADSGYHTISADQLFA